MANEPIDLLQRDQLVSSQAQRIFVEAGAGSGKTHALTSRVVHLVATGRARIDQIVAITFTEAAASELKARIRYFLEQEVNGQDRQRSQLCAAALQSLGNSYIGTIHGWAQRILGDYFLQANLPPSFDVMDNIASRLDMSDSWASFAATYLSSPEVDADAVTVFNNARALGTGRRHLEQLYVVMGSRWERCRAYSDRPVPSIPRPNIDNVRAIARELLTQIDVPSGEDKMTKHLSGSVKPWFDAFDDQMSNHPESVVAWLRVFPAKASTTLGNKKNWGPGLQSVRDLVEDLNDAVVVSLDPVKNAVVDGLVVLCAKHVVEQANKRRKHGRLGFHDLLVFATDLLVGHVEVVKNLKRSVRFVFVDEYQDTDPLQAQMVDQLATGEDAAAVFTVGDPRQSIYRFRGADIAQFHAARELANEQVVLRTNFRTVTSVVDWISQVSEALTGVFADQGNRLTGFREVLAGLGSVQMFGGVADEAMRAPAVRTLEAREVAERIARVIDEGVVVHDGRDVRRAKYGDIAILMPTRVGLAATTKALGDLEIPFRIESRSLVWATQEVRDVVAILSAIEDADDEVALVAALTTAALGCSDADLKEWKTSGGHWDYRRQYPDAKSDSTVAIGFDWLRQLHYVRWRYNVAHFTSIVLEQCRMYEAAHLQPRQREPWHRYRFVEDKARRWLSDSGDGTLSGFLSWAREQIVHEADSLESIIPESDDDAVRIMTIHASKGLEFPIVFVTGINSGRGNTSSIVLRWLNDRCVARIGNKKIGWGTPGFETDIAEEEAADDHERNRQLYVALTRARDHLFVSTHRSKNSYNTMAAVLEKAAEGSALPVNEKPTIDFVASEPKTESLVTPAAESAKRRNAATAHARRAVAVSASTANKDIAGEPETPLDGPSREERMAFGTLVHAVLERVLEGVQHNELHSIVEAMCNEAELSHRLTDALKAVAIALESDPIRQALLADHVRKEVPVSAPCEQAPGTYIHGTIDLAYLEEGKWHIVDYKTDELRDEHAGQRLIAHYQTQLMVYSVALEQATGIEVASASLLLIDPNSERAQVQTITPDAKKRSQLQKQLGTLFKN